MTKWKIKNNIFLIGDTSAFMVGFPASHVSFLRCNYEGVYHDYPPKKKTNMTMEHQPFEDVFPIEHGDFPSSHVSFLGCNI